jgi:hypothetical protein
MSSGQGEDGVVVVVGVVGVGVGAGVGAGPVGTVARTVAHATMHGRTIAARLIPAAYGPGPR